MPALKRVESWERAAPPSVLSCPQGSPEQQELHEHHPVLELSPSPAKQNQVRVTFGSCLRIARNLLPFASFRGLPDACALDTNMKQQFCLHQG